MRISQAQTITPAYFSNNQKGLQRMSERQPARCTKRSAQCKQPAQPWLRASGSLWNSAGQDSQGKLASRSPPQGTDRDRSPEQGKHGHPRTPVLLSRRLET